nr:unnamed protein product [Callosobruchus analis]
MLMPIFDEAAEEVGKVVMGKVDCEKESSIASRFHITKYPTLKVSIRSSWSVKRSYCLLLSHFFTVRKIKLM